MAAAGLRLGGWPCQHPQRPPRRRRAHAASRCTTQLRLAVAVALACVQPELTGSEKPALKVWPALKLAGEPWNENFATKNQAMNVWQTTAVKDRELVVALIHQYRDIDKRSDDRQYAIVWESDGVALSERGRIRMTCPDVELAVPSRGPFVYEARLRSSPYGLHPECSCNPSSTTACPPGVSVVETGGRAWNLTSPLQTHFVTLQNDWLELIADPAVLGRLPRDVEASVVPVSMKLLNATAAARGVDALYACPATSDELLGGDLVTKEQLKAQNMQLPAGHVQGRWCLVRRGRCSATTKVKVCEISGAVGTIIVDHGNFPNDQDIHVRFSRAAEEAARRPVLFVSEAEGDRLIEAIDRRGAVRVKVGPSVAGPPPPGYTPGAGLIVHKVDSLGNVTQTEVVRKSYPDIFGPVGWIEASDKRDVLFVCIDELNEVRLYDIKRPLEDIPLLSKIRIRCRRSGSHDYRVLDYVDEDGRYTTLLIDPANFGNRLFYYDTHDVRRPELKLQLHAGWEAREDGLGQVRPGGPDGRLHVVTWHCSSLYCGKNHGDSVYVLDSRNLTAPARRVPLPMLSRGGYARDVACGADGICLVSLTWDGLVALDSGADGSSNPLSIVAETTFNNAVVPNHLAHMRLYSGAQKVYTSKRSARRFYIEHADFQLRPLRMGDLIRALQLKDLYVAELDGYNASRPLPQRSRTSSTVTVLERPDVDEEDFWGVDDRDAEDREVSVPLTVLLLVTLCGILMFALVLFLILLRARRITREQQKEIERLQASERALSPSPSNNVVVGRPVPSVFDASAAGEGQFYSPTTVRVPESKGGYASVGKSTP